MEYDFLTDTVKGVILYKTVKSVSVLIDYIQYFIPDSIIHNLEDINVNDKELEQEFEIELRYLKRNNINGWK